MSSPVRQGSSSAQHDSPREMLQPDVERETRQLHQQYPQYPQHHQHHGYRRFTVSSTSSSQDDRMSSDFRFQRAPEEQQLHRYEQRFHVGEQRGPQSGQQDMKSTSDRYAAWKEQRGHATYESSSYGQDYRARPEYPAIPAQTGAARDTLTFEHPPFMPQRNNFLGAPPPPRHEVHENSVRSRDAESTLSPTLRHPQAVPGPYEVRAGPPPSSWPERSMADVSPPSSRGEPIHASGPSIMSENQTPSVLAPSVPAPPPAWRPSAEEHEQSAIERPGGNAATPICSNCATLTTPLWRRDGRGGLLCNACGLFVRVKGRPRPVSMKTDVIKSRARRSKAGLPLVGSGAAAAAAPDYSLPDNARYGSSQDAYRSRDLPGEGSSPETSMSMDRLEESGSWRESYGGREFASNRTAPGQQGWNNNTGPRMHTYGHAAERGSPREFEPFQPSPSSYGSSAYDGRRSDYFEDHRDPQRSSRYAGQGPEGGFAPLAAPPPMLPSTSRIDQQMRLGPSSEYGPSPGWRGARLPPLLPETEASNSRLPALLHSSFPPSMRRSSFDRGGCDMSVGAVSAPSPSMYNSDPLDGSMGGRLARRRSSDSRSAPYQKRRFEETPPSLQARPMSSIVDGPPRLPALHGLQHPGDGPGGSLRLPPLSSLTGTSTGRLSPSDSMVRRDSAREH